MSGVVGRNTWTRSKEGRRGMNSRRALPMMWSITPVYSSSERTSRLRPLRRALGGGGGMNAREEAACLAAASVFALVRDGSTWYAVGSAMRRNGEGVGIAREAISLRYRGLLTKPQRICKNQELTFFFISACFCARPILYFLSNKKE